MLFGNFESIVSLMMKINDLVASNAAEVMMRIQIGVKPPDVTASLHHPNQSRLSKGQNGSIDRVKRERREFPPEFSKDLVSGGMFARSCYFFVNNIALGSDFDPVFPALLGELPFVHRAVLVGERLYRNDSYLVKGFLKTASRALRGRGS